MPCRAGTRLLDHKTELRFLNALTRRLIRQRPLRSPDWRRAPLVDDRLSRPLKNLRFYRKRDRRSMQKCRPDHAVENGTLSRPWHRVPSGLTPFVLNAPAIR